MLLKLTVHYSLQLSQVYNTFKKLNAVWHPGDVPHKILMEWNFHFGDILPKTFSAKEM